MYERVGESVISVCKRTFKGPTDAFMIVKETRKCPGLVIYFENTSHLQQLKLESWAGWENYNRYKHARSQENAHRLYKIPAKSPVMRIDFAYNFSSVTYPAPPLSVSRSQHSRPFEMFFFLLFIAIFYRRWSKDPFTKGAYSEPVVGMTPQDFSNLAENLGRLYFAGEATSENWYGYMQGAYFTGKKQGQKIADDFLQKKLERNEL